MSKQIYLFSTSTHPDAKSINSLDIKLFKPDIDFSKYDYFIITSKQISESLKQYEDSMLKPALCVSSQSALSYELIGGEILDIGCGYGDNLIERIKEYPKETRWLYLRAKVVASDFVNVCKDDGYDIDEIVLYESDCSKEIQNVDIEDDSVLIFTSPSSIKCFLKNHSIGQDSTVIVIGKTTAKSLPKEVSYLISNDTTIESCIDLAKKI